MIDFDALVLGPCMAAFARPITVQPFASQPGEAPYEAEGIWSSKPVDVQMEDGSILSSQNHTLGIRLADFLAPPVQGDRVTIDSFMSLPRIGVCLIEDTDDDGQGGSEWMLKVIGP